VVPGGYRLRGALDLSALAGSLSEVVRRHEALRTTFARVNGEPAQRIAPPFRVPLPEVDLGALPADAAAAEAERLAAAESVRPFDLKSGPLLRATILRRGAGERTLLVTLHHIVSDAWSMEILVREVAALSAAIRAGRPSPRPAGSAGNGGSAGLPALPVQYADFAAWQRRWLEGDGLAAELAWWRDELAGAPTELALPTDRPRPPVLSFRGRGAEVALSRELADGLRRLGRERGATLFMTLLAAFQVVLGRTAGQLDLLVGSPIANRGRREVQGLIGFFVNTLVLRGRLAGAPPFADLLARTRSRALGAYSHQDLPFERLVEALAVPRSLARNPLFQAMLVVQHAAPEGPPLADVAIEPLPLATTTAKFDLNLSLTEADGTLAGGLEYSTDLFDATTAERLLARFAVLLAAAVAAPETPIDALPLLSPAERHQAVLEWNDTATAAVPGGDLAQRLAVWAARTPNAPAVSFRGETLTYRELDRHANGLAHRLREVGVGADSIVALRAERSLAMIVAVLAALKAGAAYLPIDPAYPAERQAFMLADAAAAVLLADGRASGGLPPFAGPVLWLEKETATADAPPAGLPTPLSLAYVLFTSGSTGRPKGVAMSRGALANLLAWQEREALATPARTLQFASLSFDVSFQEILSTVWTGGTLVLVDEATRRDGEALLTLLARERVERVFLPFVALRHLAEAAELTGHRLPLRLRDVVAAGEQLQVTPVVVSWLSRLPGVRLHNHYGPTEAHVVTALTLGGPPAAWPALPSIGR
ncbi:MAG TPA: condensation domain-containing protein, partial [Thermoanaerobaculia bacterium]